MIQSLKCSLHPNEIKKLCRNGARRWMALSTRHKLHRVRRVGDTSKECSSACVPSCLSLPELRRQNVHTPCSWCVPYTPTPVCTSPLYFSHPKLHLSQRCCQRSTRMCAIAVCIGVDSYFDLLARRHCSISTAMRGLTSCDCGHLGGWWDLRARRCATHSIFQQIAVSRLAVTARRRQDRGQCRKLTPHSQTLKPLSPHLIEPEPILGFRYFLKCTC
jgi:hypothetical protein